MTIIGILALFVMAAATGGMFWQFFKINRDNGESQNKSDQLLVKCDQVLGKFDQLIVLLTAIAASPAANKPPARKRPAERPAGRGRSRKMTETATTSEPKGGNDGGNGI